ISSLSELKRKVVGIFRYHILCLQMIVDVLFVLALDRAAQQGEQQAELELHAHAVVADGDSAVRTAALELQGIATPAVLHVVLAGQALGQRLGLLASGGEAEGMGAFDGDAGHARLLLRPCVTRLYQLRPAPRQRPAGGLEWPPLR